MELATIKQAKTMVKMKTVFSIPLLDLYIPMESPRPEAKPCPLLWINISIVKRMAMIICTIFTIKRTFIENYLSHNQSKKVYKKLTNNDE